MFMKIDIGIKIDIGMTDQALDKAHNHMTPHAVQPAESRLTEADRALMRNKADPADHPQIVLMYSSSTS